MSGNRFVNVYEELSRKPSEIINLESDALKYEAELERRKAVKDDVDKFIAIVNTLSTPFVFFPQVTTIKAAANILLAVNAVSSFYSISNNYSDMIEEEYGTHVSIKRCRNLIADYESKGKKVSHVRFSANYQDKYVNSKLVGRYLVGVNTTSVHFTDGTSIGS